MVIEVCQCDCTTSSSCTLMLNGRTDCCFFNLPNRPKLTRADCCIFTLPSLSKWTICQPFGNIQPIFGSGCGLCFRQHYKKIKMCWFYEQTWIQVKLGFFKRLLACLFRLANCWKMDQLQSKAFVHCGWSKKPDKFQRLTLMFKTSKYQNRLKKVECKWFATWPPILVHKTLLYIAP